MMNREIPQVAKDLSGKDKVRVLFVCLGNICRSPAAEGVMRSMAEEKEARPAVILLIPPVFTEAMPASCPTAA